MRIVSIPLIILSARDETGGRFSTDAGGFGDVNET